MYKEHLGALDLPSVSSPIVKGRPAMTFTYGRVSEGQLNQGVELNLIHRVEPAAGNKYTPLGIERLALHRDHE